MTVAGVIGVILPVVGLIVYCESLIAARDSGDLAADEPANDDGLTDWSEHGLGLYMDATDLPKEHQRDEDGRRRWIRETWEWLLADLDNQHPPMPPYLLPVNL